MPNSIKNLGAEVTIHLENHDKKPELIKLACEGYRLSTIQEDVNNAIHHCHYDLTAYYFRRLEVSLNEEQQFIVDEINDIKTILNGKDSNNYFLEQYFFTSSDNLENSLLRRKIRDCYKDLEKGRAIELSKDNFVEYISCKVLHEYKIWLKEKIENNTSNKSFINGDNNVSIQDIKSGRDIYINIEK